MIVIEGNDITSLMKLELKLDHEDPQLRFAQRDYDYQWLHYLIKADEDFIYRDL